MAPIPRILVVEDDEIIGNLISTMLERKGYSVIGQVMSGEEAIIKSAELEPDLVLMDINLCGILDGVSAARYIFTLFQVPIIFLTALSDDSLLERAKGAQPYGFIMKPFTDKELLSNVQLGLYNHSIRKKFLDKYPVGDPKKIMNALEVVVITDTRGRIIFFNPYTTRLFDATDKQLLMNPFRNVVTLVNDQTNEPLEDLISEVTAQMLVVMHEFNTELVTRSGKRRKVSVIARPIKDERNELMGVFIHIREKSLDQIKMAKKG
ncbi:MAG TPA: response regulator [Methanoregula sp.]|nr:response regulator [Methanoregula sp.]